MSSHRIVASVLVFSLLAYTVGAAQAPPAPPASSVPAAQTVVRITTRLIQVNVVAHDKAGRPVSGLQRDDFVLLEEGKPQEIRVFEVQSRRAADTTLSPLPPNTYSNQLSRRPGAPTSLTVILFDGLNTRFLEQASARAQILKFLRQLQPQDRVAIFALGRQLRVIHDFSSDTGSLIRALDRHKARLNSEVDASALPPSDSGDPEIDALLDAMNERMENFYIEDRVRTTLRGIEAIANYLAGLPGRKNLIWVSGGFPFSYGMDITSNLSSDRRSFAEEIARTSRAVNGASVAIYPVDARGLIGMFDYAPSFSPGARSMGRAQMARMDNRARYQIAGSHGTMQEIADRTGGRAFYNTNDIAGSIRTALDDSEVTYTLGYYPADTNWNGKFRQLKVSVKRPGVQVRYRRGFYAFPDEKLDEQQINSLVVKSLWSPLDATGIPFSIRLNPDSPKQAADFVIYLDPHSVTFTKDGGLWRGKVIAVFLQKSADGKALASRQETVDVTATDSQYEKMVENGMTMQGSWRLEKGANELRVVLRDAASGAMGSLGVPVKGE